MPMSRYKLIASLAITLALCLGSPVFGENRATSTSASDLQKELEGELKSHLQHLPSIKVSDAVQRPPATKPPRKKPPQASQSVLWYWINVQVADRPGCIALDEEPLNSLARHFGSASMRVIQDVKHREGRIMVVEVQTPSGPEAFGYATSESICNRVRTATLAATKDIVANQSKNAQLFRLEPADVAKVRIEDPDVFCAGDLCSTKLDNFIRFRGERICRADITFSANQENHSAGCTISAGDAQRIITILRDSLGMAAMSERSIPPTRSTHYVWDDGPLKIELVRFWGASTQGIPLNSWSISVSRN